MLGKRNSCFPAKISAFARYIESVTCAYLFFGYILAFVFHTISALLERRPSVVEALAAFAPGIALFHALRKLSMARVKLFSDMEHFDMDDVKCSEEFDREFVLTAINDWYGSSEAFVAYVRGPLRTEMSKMVLKASTHLAFSTRTVLIFELPIPEACVFTTLPDGREYWTEDQLDVCS